MEKMPDLNELYLPLLKFLADGKPHRMPEIVEHLATEFRLTDSQREERVKSGSKRFDNRIAWTRANLKMALLVDNTPGGIIITARGQEALSQKPEIISHKFLCQYPEYAAKISKKKKNATTLPSIEQKEETSTPEELMEVSYTNIRKKLADDLYDKIFEKKPDFFERLVVKLLVKMGYGGSLEDAGESIGRSGDGGIDGIIKEDRLGLDMIYIQAKRWNTSQSVGRPEIQKFVGALAGHGAKKGVFITTASFSEEARNYRPHNDTKIVLIDGKQLMQLMIDFNLGVSTDITYEIKRIDNDFFDEN